jgi:hypothetical protein
MNARHVFLFIGDLGQLLGGLSYSADPAFWWQFQDVRGIV